MRARAGQGRDEAGDGWSALHPWRPLLLHTSLPPCLPRHPPTHPPTHLVDQRIHRIARHQGVERIAQVAHCLCRWRARGGGAGKGGPAGQGSHHDAGEREGARGRARAATLQGAACLANPLHKPHWSLARPHRHKPARTTRPPTRVVLVRLALLVGGPVLEAQPGQARGGAHHRHPHRLGNLGGQCGGGASVGGQGGREGREGSGGSECAASLASLGRRRDGAAGNAAAAIPGGRHEAAAAQCTPSPVPQYI